MDNLRMIAERKKLGLSQKELADKLKVSQKRISKYERGTRRPSYETLAEMSSIFGVSVDSLLGLNHEESNGKASEFGYSGDDEDAIAFPNNRIRRCFMSSGEKLKSLREEKGLTQKQMAEILGVSKSNISKYEAGAVEPNLDTLKRYANYFNVSTDNLLGLKKSDSVKDYKLGIKLKELRGKSGKSQQEVCSVLNIEQSTLANYENGKRIPKIDIIIKLAAFYNVSVDYLVGSERDTSSRTVIPESFHSNISECIKYLNRDYGEIAESIGLTKKEFLDCKEDLAFLPYSALEKLSRISQFSTDYIVGLRNESREKGDDDQYPFLFDEQIGKRIQQFCEEKEYTSEDLERYLSMSADEVHHMLAYGFIPHVNTIIKLANLFDTTSDYLLCLIDNRTDKAIRAFQLMNEDSKDIIVGKIKEVLRDQRHEQLYENAFLAPKKGNDSEK